jgi:hypothetical protein
VRRARERVSAIVVAGATCNTRARDPLATSMTVSPSEPPVDRAVSPGRAAGCTRLIHGYSSRSPGRRDRRAAN